MVRQRLWTPTIIVIIWSLLQTTSKSLLRASATSGTPWPMFTALVKAMSERLPKAHTISNLTGICETLLVRHSTNPDLTPGRLRLRTRLTIVYVLGALGPVDGVNPELSNLTCSMTYVQPGDIVFLTSDGISDNFDPVVGKFCIPRKSERPPGEQGRSSRKQRPQPINNSSLPPVEAYQRHELTLLRMEDLLNHGSGSESSTLQSLGVSGRVQTAAELCHRMVDFCQRLTTAKRKILEDPDLYPEVYYYYNSQLTTRR
jgi:hypothetical protein